MKKNLLLTGKLGSYTALACSVLATHEADAQVVYTDVDPDAVINSSDLYGFDLDNDGSDDFGLINVLYSGIGAMNVLVYPTGGVAGYIDSILGSTFPFASAFNDGAAIGPSLQWYSTTGGAPLLWGTFAVVGSLGAFNNANDKFIGLRFKIGADFHYGWARLDVTHTTITLKDFAYNATANASINTNGDVAIQTPGSEFHPAIYSIDGGVHIALPETISDASVSIFDLSGRMIHSEMISGTADMMLSQFPNGIYMIEIETGDQQFSGLFGLK